MLSKDNRKEIGIFFIVAGLLMLIPGLNAWGPDSGALSVSSFKVSLWGKYLTYAILAMSLNLLWGLHGLAVFVPKPVLCLGWLCDGHVFDANDW